MSAVKWWDFPKAESVWAFCSVPKISCGNRQDTQAGQSYLSPSQRNIPTIFFLKYKPKTAFTEGSFLSWHCICLSQDSASLEAPFSSPILYPKSYEKRNQHWRGDKDPIHMPISQSQVEVIQGKELLLWTAPINYFDHSHLQLVHIHTYQPLFKMLMLNMWAFTRLSSFSEHQVWLSMQTRVMLQGWNTQHFPLKACCPKAASKTSQQYIPATSSCSSHVTQVNPGNMQDWEITRELEHRQRASLWQTE